MEDANSPQEVSPVAKQKSSVQKYRKARFDKLSNKWESWVRIRGKDVYLSSFNTEREAAATSDIAALMEHGKGTTTYFPETDYLDDDGNIIENPEVRKKIDEYFDPDRCNAPRRARRRTLGEGIACGPSPSLTAEKRGRLMRPVMHGLPPTMPCMGE
eukprot:364451-Chlamydomonas_euryale.AAC.10